MSVTSLDTSAGSRASALIPAWLWIGMGTFVLVLLQGASLLRDTDTLWQIKVGQWILDHHTLPVVDMFSLTKSGQPWMSSSCLAQVVFAKIYALAGWNGVVIISALAIAVTFAQLVTLLERHIPAAYAIFIAIGAFVMSEHHFLARPHVLAMPFMVAWIGGLIAASDRGTKPSFWLLPLIVFWANLHGGFVLGLALIAPIALDAVCNAEAPQRRTLLIQWAIFGVAALIAACITPYGWNSLLAARKILDLGTLLTLISEWAPVSFASFGTFEGGLLVMIGATLCCGLVLPPTRILLTLGLLHMALGHVRNVEVFVLLVPIMLAAPVARQFFAQPETVARLSQKPRSPWVAMTLAFALAVVLASAWTSSRPFVPEDESSYANAVAALREHKATRVFNDYGFGGYLIWVGIPPFIDGRAELYGEAFALDVLHATSLSDPDSLVRLLNTNKIDATLMYPTTPAAHLLDHVDGWTRVFTSDLAVVHIRTSSIDNTPLRLNMN